MDDYILMTFISTNITRIGAVLLIIYGVRIMVNLYKYNMKMSAFYDSRADIVELVGNKPELSFDEITKAFRIDNIDFGSNINTPIDDITKIIDAVKKSTDNN